MMSIFRLTSRIFPVNHCLTELSGLAQSRSIKRWVAPTLRELRKRAKKLGPQEPERRSNFLEWNYQSELFSFSKRLNEDFQLPLLQTAFTDRSHVLLEEKRQSDLGVENTDINTKDNRELAEWGLKLSRSYVESFLKTSLPNLPEEGQGAITNHLLSVACLSNIAFNLGMKDLIFSSEYPPEAQTAARAFLAVIGALEESSGVGKAFLFIRDFICTQLNQCDLMDIWHIEDPEEMLKKICRERQIAELEPRLIGDSAKNTVLATYHVGVYADKELIGKGFGEDVDTAVKTASLDALRSIFKIQDNMIPFNFELQTEPSSIKMPLK